MESARGRRRLPRAALAGTVGSIAILAIAPLAAFMYLGELLEFGATDEIFVNPKLKATDDYISGRFG